MHYKFYLIYKVHMKLAEVDDSPEALREKHHRKFWYGEKQSDRKSVV